jgi:hypothetical protein
MDKGFIKLSRSFFDNKIWQAARAFSECEAWIDLIQAARFEASPTTSRIGCYEVTWERGQYPASNRFLAKKWGRSEQWVKSFLGKLKREKMITTDNSQGINVITLVNFEKYNGEVTENPPNNPPCNSPNQLIDGNLQELVTHLVTQQVTHLLKEQPTSNPNNKKEENIKETTPNGVAKKDAAKAATLTRKNSFYQSLVPYVGKYPKDMIRAFFDYWSELNKSETKMRYELEKTWELPKRLATWASKERMPAKPATDIGVVLNNNSPDKYDSPQERKWEERWNK